MDRSTYSKSLKWICLLVLFIAVNGNKHLTDLEKIRSLYKPKVKPKPGDWLAQYKETHYSFETYKNAWPARPDSVRKIIYIYKLGANTKAEDSLLQIACKYLERTYHLKTRMGKTFPLSCVPAGMKRLQNGNNLQVRTYFVLDTLAGTLPEDAAVSICFTKYDLYPDPSWNFVFGQAYLKKRVGVWSFSRYGNANNAWEFSRVLKRTLKVASHETGHMFSVTHCVRYECGMNGSNSLNEMDACTLHFCPDCLEKLSWNIGFKLKEHFKGLQSFYEEYKLAEEAHFIEKNNSYLHAHR